MRGAVAREWVINIVLLLAVILLAGWAAHEREQRIDQVATLTEQNAALTREVRSLALTNCSTINENTTAVYGVALAFKALAQIINGSGILPPDGKLRAVVEEPEYLECK